MSYVFSKALRETPEDKERRKSHPAKWTHPHPAAPQKTGPPPVASKPKPHAPNATNGSTLQESGLSSDSTRKISASSLSNSGLSSSYASGRHHGGPAQSGGGESEVMRALRKTSLPARTQSVDSPDFGTGPKMGGRFARLQFEVQHGEDSKKGLYTDAYEAYKAKKSLKEHGVLPSNQREKLRKYSQEAPVTAPKPRHPSAGDKRDVFARNRSLTTPTSPTANFFNDSPHEHEKPIAENAEEDVFEDKKPATETPQAEPVVNDVNSDATAEVKEASETDIVTATDVNSDVSTEEKQEADVTNENVAAVPEVEISSPQTPTSPTKNEFGDPDEIKRLEEQPEVLAMKHEIQEERKQIQQGQRHLSDAIDELENVDFGLDNQENKQSETVSNETPIKENDGDKQSKEEKPDIPQDPVPTEVETPATNPTVEDTPSEKPAEVAPAATNPTVEDTPSEKPAEVAPAATEPTVEDTPSEKSAEVMPAATEPTVEDTPSEKPAEVAPAATEPTVEDTPSEKSAEVMPAATEPTVEDTPSEKPAEVAPAATEPTVEDTPAATEPTVEDAPSEKPAEIVPSNTTVEETPTDKPTEVESAANNPTVENTPSDKLEEVETQASNPTVEDVAAEKPAEVELSTNNLTVEDTPTDKPDTSLEETASEKPAEVETPATDPTVEDATSEKLADERTTENQAPTLIACELSGPPAVEETQDQNPQDVINNQPETNIQSLEDTSTNQQTIEQQFKDLPVANENEKQSENINNEQTEIENTEQTVIAPQVENKDNDTSNAAVSSSEQQENNQTIESEQQKEEEKLDANSNIRLPMETSI